MSITSIITRLPTCPLARSFSLCFIPLVWDGPPDAHLMGEVVLHQGVQSKSDPIMACLFLVFHLRVTQTDVDEDVCAQAKDSSIIMMIREVWEFDAFQHIFTPRAFSWSLFTYPCQLSPLRFWPLYPLFRSTLPPTFDTFTPCKMTTFPFSKISKNPIMKSESGWNNACWE